MIAPQSSSSAMLNPAWAPYSLRNRPPEAKAPILEIGPDLIAKRVFRHRDIADDAGPVGRADAINAVALQHPAHFRKRGLVGRNMLEGVKEYTRSNSRSANFSAVASSAENGDERVSVRLEVIVEIYAVDPAMKTSASALASSPAPHPTTSTRFIGFVFCFAKSPSTTAPHIGILVARQPARSGPLAARDVLLAYHLCLFTPTPIPQRSFADTARRGGQSGTLPVM